MQTNMRQSMLMPKSGQWKLAKPQIYPVQLEEREEQRLTSSFKVSLAQRKGKHVSNCDESKHKKWNGFTRVESENSVSNPPAGRKQINFHRHQTVVVP
jgi:hypothetical protein